MTTTPPPGYRRRQPRPSPSTSTTRRAVLALALASAPGALACAEDKPPAEAGAATTPPPISYYGQVRPIFQARCHGCHQPAKANGGYVMTDFARLLAGGEGGEPVVVPQKPGESFLLELITPDEGGEAEMPKKRDPLSSAEIALVKRWIAEGAVDDTPESTVQRYDQDNPPTYVLPPVVTALDYSPDGELLAVSGYHEVLVHKADGSGLVARLVGLSERIEAVAFSPDGTRLAVTGGLPARMGEVQVWDLEERSLTLSHPVTFDTVYGASWSPDGNLLAFGCADTTVRVIEAKSGKQVLFQGSHDDWVLDTVFSVKGDHIVTVGRDRTVKLTEVATQRFIDNVTSITPGALKGGILAIDRHPLRDEVLVGGADGVPKLYRMHRVTARKIGDDANLLLEFPPLPGRVFSVAYSRDAKTVAAGSSLNGAGTVHVYNLDPETKAPDNIHKILIKPTHERNGDEHEALRNYYAERVATAAKVEIPGGVYAVALNPAGTVVAAAGADGIVRLIDATSGALVKDFLPVPINNDKGLAAYSIDVEPPAVELGNGFDYKQLLITAHYSDGTRADVTRAARAELSAAVAEVSANGLVTPLADGAARLTLRFGGRTASVPVTVAGTGEAYAVDYIRDVMPVISKLGCNAGTCHGSKDGKNGFKLSLRGYDPIYDVRAFTDDLAARRVNVAAPDNSLMLLKATGAVPHEGDQLTRTGEKYYQVIRSWIAGGAKLDLAAPRVTGIEILPRDPVVQKIGDAQQMRVVATYADGSRRDVTAESFIESGNGDIAKTDASGLVTVLRRGEAPVLARFEGAYAATTVTAMGDRSGFVWEQPPANNAVDLLAAKKWERMKILPSGLSSDAAFIRRVHLDLTGLPPSGEAVRAFLADTREAKVKRDEVIDALIGSEAFVDYWTNKWADLLQVNRKFLGAEGAASFRRWIRAEVDANTPYDQFVRKILTASGSNKENPPASYYKVLRTPEDTMENTTHLFLATRFNCNKCHDHPFERWTQNQYYEMAAFFARTGLKMDPASGKNKIGGTAVEGAKPLYEIVFEKPEGEVVHERTGAVTAPEFPYAAAHGPAPEASRREKLAAWITSKDNRYFARSYANRLWGYLLGVGLIEPIDDIRAGNPPTNPELLDYLTEQFIGSGFDARHLIRLICRSRTYQLSVETNRWNEDDGVNYSHAIAKRLPAEVLYDAIYTTTGATSGFPGVPAGTRASALPDVGVELPDGFLNNLGRPPRESACECERSNDLQLGPVMALVSGPTLGTAVSDPKNAIAELAASDLGEPALINELFLRILNRPAQEKEVEVGLEAFRVLEEEHASLVAAMEAHEKKIAPRVQREEAERQARIDEAKKNLQAYEKEIAPREAQLDAEQKGRVQRAEAVLQASEESLPGKLAAWEAARANASGWVVLNAAELASSAGAKLESLEDGSVLVSGKKERGTYTFTAKTDLTGITAVRLEAITDDRLPKKGPGRASDGNFVLTEFDLKAAPASDPGKAAAVKLHHARATFSQKVYDVTTAVDGKAPDKDNGWAISPKTGVTQVAVFEAHGVVGHDGGTLLTFTLNQNYTSKEHSLGRFRLSVTTDPPPIDFGLPGEIQEVLKVAGAGRSGEQAKKLLDYFRQNNAEHQERVQALAEAKKPRPVDPELKGLRDHLNTVSQPLPVDPLLARYRHDVGLSEAQLKNRRLTGAQDIAWALLNSPAFLFNH